MEIIVMKRFWKPLVLALALSLGGAFGFFATEVQAAPQCGQICCPDTGQCFDCSPRPKGGGCVCPLIGCV
jgi:hypothetical protein